MRFELVGWVLDLSLIVAFGFLLFTCGLFGCDFVLVFGVLLLCILL